MICHENDMHSLVNERKTLFQKILRGEKCINCKILLLKGLCTSGYTVVYVCGWNITLIPSPVVNKNNWRKLYLLLHLHHYFVGKQCFDSLFKIYCTHNYSLWFFCEYFSKRKSSKILLVSSCKHSIKIVFLIRCATFNFTFLSNWKTYFT